MIKSKISLPTFGILISLILIISCKKAVTYDLAIENVKIFDAKNKQVIEDKTILINADTIVDIVSSDSKLKGIKSIDGMNRLVSPGFIDTHIHLTDIFGDYEEAPEYIKADSADIYRKKLAETYLKYGVTTVLGAGQPEKWLPISLNWQQNPNPNYPNIFNSGSAIISDEERNPYIGHIEVQSPLNAANKIEEYHNLGIKHIKLYWRLREPEMKAVIEKANKFDMYVCGHIDQNIVSINSALELGLKNYEHFLSLAFSVFKYNDHYQDFADKHGIEKLDNNSKMLAMMIQTFKYINETPELNVEFESLLNNLSEHQTSISTTIHLLASILDKTYFKIKPISASEEGELEYTPQQLKNLNKAYELMMVYLKKAHNKGIKLRIGTDCREGGKAMISELMLLHQAGFPIEDIFQIATLNGAESINVHDSLGSIEKGKKADLIIFEDDPFDNYKNFSAEKIIIKGGKIYEN